MEIKDLDFTKKWHIAFCFEKKENIKSFLEEIINQSLKNLNEMETKFPCIIYSKEYKNYSIDFRLIVEYFCDWLIKEFNIKEVDILNFKKLIYIKDSEYMKFFLYLLYCGEILTIPPRNLAFYKLYRYKDRYFILNHVGIKHSAVIYSIGEKAANEFQEKCNFTDVKHMKYIRYGVFKVHQHLRMLKKRKARIILNVMNSFNVPDYAKLAYFE